MEEPGQKLRKARERLGLRYRDVEEASQQIASRRGNDEFAVGLSRLADIENRGTLPSLFRLYSLCAIYRLDFADVLQWYGIALAELSVDAARIAMNLTHLVEFEAADIGALDFPAQMESKIDLRKTEYLNRHVRKWGKLPLNLLSGMDVRRQRYGFIGTNDWSMHPILPPGSFIQIDETKRRIVDESWTSENERPIYFLEHREGFRCSWCTERDGIVIAQAHTSSGIAPEIYKRGEVDVIGQVVGVAMRLDLGKRRHTRF